MRPPVDMHMPHGTVSVTIDESLGMVTIFAVQQPDPEDWRAAVRLADAYPGGRWSFMADGDIDVIEIAIDAGQGSAVA